MRTPAVIALAFALTAGGCDLVFDLSNVPDQPRRTDALAPIVTGRHHMRYVTNDAQFEPVVVEEAYPIGEIAMAAVLDDGTQAAVDYQSDGTFSFARAYEGQPYRLIITADARTAEVQHTSAQLDIAALWAGRRNTRPLLYTVLSVPFPDAFTATSTLFLASTGVWTHTNTGLYGPNATFDWRLASPLGHPGMLETAEHDRLYALELDTFATSGSAPTYLAIKAESATSIDQLPSTITSVAGPSAVTHDACIHLSAPNVAEVARIQSATARSYTSTESDWLLYKTPAPDQTQLAGLIWIALSSQNPAVNLDVAPSFYDPFPGGELVAESGAFGRINVTLPGTALPLQLLDITRRYHRVARAPLGNCGAAEDLAPTVAIAGNVMLDGVALDADNKSVSVDLSRDVPVSWSLVAPGSVHTMIVQLYELEASGSGTTSALRRSITTVAPSALLDHTLLQVGHTYVIALVTNLTYANAASGDLSTITWPIENSTVWTRYFRVDKR